MFKHYIKSAFRNIFKNRVSAIIAIFGLAAGIICFSFCMYYVMEMKAVNNGYRDSERLVIFKAGTNGKYEFDSYPSFSQEVRSQELEEIEAVTTILGWGNSLMDYDKNDGSKQIHNSYYIESDQYIIDVLGLKIIEGTINNIKQNPNSIIITESLAKKIYQNECAINNNVYWSGTISFNTIQAVVQDFPDNISIDNVKPDFIIIKQDKILDIHGVDVGFISEMESVAKLSPGYSITDLNKRLNDISFSKSVNKNDYDFKAVNYIGIIKKNNEIYYFLFITGCLILLISVLNYIVFIIGIHKNRSKEYFLRNILGSTPVSFFRLISSEILISILISGLIIFIVTEFIGNIVDINIPKERIIFSINTKKILFQQIGYILFLIILSVPVLMIYLKSLYKKRFISGFIYTNHVFRNSMLFIQFFISFVFLSGGFLIYGQSYITDKTIYSNFTKEEKERIFYIDLNNIAFGDESIKTINNIKSNSNIEDILYINSRFSDDDYIIMNINDKVERCKYYNVSDNFFKFTNQSIIINNSNNNSEGVFFASMADISETPLQVTDYFYGRRYNVLGAFENKLQSNFTNTGEFHTLLFTKEENPVTNNHGLDNLYIKFNKGFKGDPITEIKNCLYDSYHGDFLPEVLSLKDEYEQLCWKEIYLRKILLVLGFISLIVTLAGVYSAINNDTIKRKKEITIRKINGASYFDIALIFSKLYLWFILSASFMAFPVIWMIADDFLSSYTIRIDINNPVYWVTIFLIIILFVFLTLFSKIRNIVKLDPCKGLRNE